MAELLKENTRKNKTDLLVNITVWVAMIVFATHAGTHMVAAGDTWVAMACGRHFATHGVDTVEPFSYNSHQAGPTEAELEPLPQWLRPVIKKYHPTGWINQNWLTQVIFYKLTTIFGSEQDPAYNLLVVWKFALNFIIIVSLYFTSRLMGAGKIVSAVAICAAMWISRSFIDIRPAVFSNVLVPVFIYILMLSLRKNALYIYLLVPLIVFWSNVHGGYLYLFIIIAPFWLFNLIIKHFKWQWAQQSTQGLLKHTFICGVISFVAMAIFNPYHLTNLTHTFIITVSEHAEEWKNVNEWHSAFNLSNPVGKSLPFVVMFIVSLVIIPFWLIVWFFKPTADAKDTPKSARNNFQWYPMPVILMFIALFTMAMAVRSRRFIPISAYTMAPLLAVMLTQVYNMLSVRRNLRSRGLFSPLEINDTTLKTASILILSVSVILGVFWAVKFDKIYLKPWPIDGKKTSVFMRMSASYAKPFEACQFIRENKLSGHMLNYWTEGGFIAYSQEPDEQTGEIPLKFFMDGRAQAAYDIEVFQEYNNNILSGGDLGKELVNLINQSKKPLNAFPNELRELSDYLDAKLAEYEAWIMLMPLSQQRGLFMRAITIRPNWQMVYLDQSQIILVNTETQKGRELRSGIFNGSTIYPNDSYRDTVIAAYKASSQPKEAFELAKTAFQNTQSTAPMSQIINIGSKSGMEQDVYDFCRSVVADFMQNKDKYRKKHGYIEKQSNAILALNFIAGSANKIEPQNVKAYRQLLSELDSQRKRLINEYNW